MLYAVMALLVFYWLEFLFLTTYRQNIHQFHVRNEKVTYILAFTVKYFILTCNHI